MAHPAQFHFFKNVIDLLKQRKHIILILIKSKDVLDKLTQNTYLNYFNILPEGRADNKISIFFSLIKRDIRLAKICYNEKPDILLGSDPSIAHIGNLFNIPSLSFIEDDYKVIRKLAQLMYPFTDYIIAPDVCDVGNWKKKKISYDGYMKLSYLHPNRFTANSQIAKEYVNINEEDFFYFIHSYYVSCNNEKDILSETKYGNDFISCFQRDNIFGSQFHPEKSHDAGLKLHKNFANL